MAEKLGVTIRNFPPEPKEPKEVREARKKEAWLKRRAEKMAKKLNENNDSNTKLSENE